MLEAKISIILTCWREDAALFQMSTLIDTCWWKLYLTAPWNRELAVRIELFPHCLRSDLQITGNQRRVTNPFFHAASFSFPHSVSLYFCLSLCYKIAVCLLPLPLDCFSLLFAQRKWRISPFSWLQNIWLCTQT